MEWRGKVCVAHLWGRAWLRPVCPSVTLACPSGGGGPTRCLGAALWLLALPVGVVLPVFRAPSLRSQDFGPSYEMLDRIAWNLNKAWRE